MTLAKRGSSTTAHAMSAYSLFQMIQNILVCSSRVELQVTITQLEIWRGCCRRCRGGYQGVHALNEGKARLRKGMSSRTASLLAKDSVWAQRITLPLSHCQRCDTGEGGLCSNNQWLTWMHAPQGRCQVSCRTSSTSIVQVSSVTEFRFKGCSSCCLSSVLDIS